MSFRTARCCCVGTDPLDSLMPYVAAMNTGEHDPRRRRVRGSAAVPDTAMILAALDADEDYDHCPDGDPPISTGQYRHIARAIANLTTATPNGPISDVPGDAHTQGQIQILDEIRRILSEIVAPPTREPETPESTE